MSALRATQDRCQGTWLAPSPAPGKGEVLEISALNCVVLREYDKWSFRNLIFLGFFFGGGMVIDIRLGSPHFSDKTD